MPIEIHVFVHDASEDDFASTRSALATTIHHSTEIIMSAISDYVAKQQAFNDRQSAAIDGITADIKFVNDKLNAIQNSPGTLSAEDQQSLDEALARQEVVTTKLEALDAQTPPTPPAA
jgi:hypothetical protein